MQLNLSLSGGAGICHDYKVGRCNRGSNCKFAHVAETDQDFINNICFAWRDDGACSRGSECRFVHEGPGKTGPSKRRADAEADDRTKRAPLRVLCCIAQMSSHVICKYVNDCCMLW
jgi:hypothetical protein